MITNQNLANWFTHHPPTADQIRDYGHLRDAARLFAELVVELTPPSADQTAAVRKIREAVMTANAAIACAGDPLELEDAEPVVEFARIRELRTGQNLNPDVGDVACESCGVWFLQDHTGQRLPGEGEAVTGDGCPACITGTVCRIVLDGLSLRELVAVSDGEECEPAVPCGVCELMPSSGHAPDCCIGYPEDNHGR